MADRQKRVTHKCPQCGQAFKNFKWVKSFKYDGDVAACPQCLLPAIEWPRPLRRRTGRRFLRNKPKGKAT